MSRIINRFKRLMLQSETGSYCTDETTISLSSREAPLSERIYACQSRVENRHLLMLKASYWLQSHISLKSNLYSSFDHSLNPFCRCREFHCSVRLKLFTQSSLLLPSGITFANGNLDAEIVT